MQIEFGCFAKSLSQQLHDAGMKQTGEEYRMYDDPPARLRSEAEQRARGHIKGMRPWRFCA